MKVDLLASTYPKYSYSKWGALFYSLQGGEGSYGHVGLRFSQLGEAEQDDIRNRQKMNGARAIRNAEIGEKMVFDLLKGRGPCFSKWNSKAVEEAWTMRSCLYVYELILDKEQTRLALQHALKLVDGGYPYSNLSYFNGCCPGRCNTRCFACAGACESCQCLGVESGHCASILYMVLANAYLRRDVPDPIQTIEDARVALPIDHPRQAATMQCCSSVPPAAFSPLDLAIALQNLGIAVGRQECVVPLVAMRF